MTPRAAATRYARALFDVGLKEADPQTVERDLAGFVDLVAAHPALEQALVNPAVPAPRKRAVVSEILARGGGVAPVVGRLLLLLADRDRLALLPHVLAAYRDRVREHLRVAQARVTAATPLPPDRLEALARRLSDVTGMRVSVEAEVEPAIIGGLVARIGSIVYDGSVARQLERMREKLIEGT